MDTLDTGIRLKSFQFLDEQSKLHGDILPRTILAKGFEANGHQIHLIGPEGIFKPAILPEIAISITTVPIVEGKPRPYEDELSDESVIRYRLGVRDSESRFPPSRTVVLLDPSPLRPPQSGARSAALQSLRRAKLQVSLFLECGPPGQAALQAFTPPTPAQTHPVFSCDHI